MKFNFILVFITILTSCNHKMIAPNEYKGDKLIFGNGGGFTGSVSSIALLDNGDVFRLGSADTSYTYLGKLDVNVIKNQFLTYGLLGIEKMELNEPGNRYYFITGIVNEKEHKIMWGKQKLDNNVPALFYANVMKLVEDLQVPSAVE